MYGALHLLSPTRHVASALRRRIAVRISACVVSPPRRLTGKRPHVWRGWFAVGASHTLHQSQAAVPGPRKLSMSISRTYYWAERIHLGITE